MLRTFSVIRLDDGIGQNGRIKPGHNEHFIAFKMIQRGAERMIFSPCCQRLASGEGVIDADLAHITEFGLGVVVSLQSVAMGISNLFVLMHPHEAVPGSELGSDDVAEANLAIVGW